MEKTKDNYQIAKEAYHAYGAVTDHKNFRGEPMPEFDDLPNKIQVAWMDAVLNAIENYAKQLQNKKAFTVRAAYPFRIERLSPPMRIDENGIAEIIDLPEVVAQAGDLVTLHEDFNFTVVKKPFVPEPPIEERRCHSCNSNENLGEGKYADIMVIIDATQIAHTGNHCWLYRCSDCK